MIATILPSCAVNDTVHFLVPGKKTPIKKLPLLCCNLNSFILDFIGRQKVGGNSYSMFIVDQLPLLPPFAYKNNWESFIIRSATELIYTSWDHNIFAENFGYIGPPFKWDEERRFLIRCELDAAFFHFYGINRNDVDYIIETFPIVKRKDIQKYGNYRTKLTILKIYDEMKKAMETSKPYQTILNPPPADPRIAHPLTPNIHDVEK